MNESVVNISTSGASANSTAKPYEVLSILDTSIYTIHFVLGFPMHCYVLSLIVKKPSGIESEFFSLNFYVCEIMYCIDSLFTVISTPEVNPLIWFLLGIGITGRPLFQCLICVERYLAVVHPVTFLKYKQLRYRIICCVVGWTLTLVSCVLLTFRLGLSNKYIYIWYSSSQFFIFISIMLFCCLAVMRALKQSGPGERKKEEENQMKRRAFHLILITTVSMAGIYVPFTVTGFSFLLSQQNNSQLFSVVFFFFILVSFVPSVLYLHRNGKLSSSCCFA